MLLLYQKEGHVKSGVVTAERAAARTARNLNASKSTLTIHPQRLSSITEHPFNMPAPTYLISKIGDPIFAVFIGLSAAATRINREEKELGYSTQQTIDAGFR
jgi:hypothetical protein